MCLHFLAPPVVTRNTQICFHFSVDFYNQDASPSKKQGNKEIDINGTTYKYQ
jgi:hypothetical protein